MACQAFGAYVLWFLGYPEQALRQSDTALTQAQELPYAFHQATALNFTSRLYHYCRDVQAALGRAETLIALSSEYGFPVWLAQGQLQRGWALSMQDRVAKAFCCSRKVWPPGAPRGHVYGCHTV